MAVAQLGLDNAGMRSIHIKQPHYDLTPTAGLALVGELLRFLKGALLKDTDHILV